MVTSLHYRKLFMEKKLKENKNHKTTMMMTTERKTIITASSIHLHMQLIITESPTHVCIVVSLEHVLTHDDSPYIHHIHQYGCQTGYKGRLAL